MSTQKRAFLAVASVLMGMGLGVLGLVLTQPKPRYVSPYTPGATPPPVPEPQTQPLVTMPTPAPATDKPAKPSVTFYTLVTTPDGTALQAQTRALEGEVLTDEARLTAAISAMTEGESPVLPKGTRLLRLKRDGSTALLDLSKELKENFSGGDKAEQLVVNALLATAGQLAGVEKVQIFIDGAAVETLGGSQTLLEPLKVPKTP